MGTVVNFAEAAARIKEAREEKATRNAPGQEATIPMIVCSLVANPKRPRIIVSSPEYGSINVPLSRGGARKVETFLNHAEMLGWDGLYGWADGSTGAALNIDKDALEHIKDVGLEIPGWRPKDDDK